MPPAKTAKSSQRRWQIRQADSLTVLPRLDADSIDAIITDPPYGINVNGMTWDRPKRLDPTRPPHLRRPRTHPNVSFQTFCTEWANRCMRVLKPGGYLAAFAAPRTAHRVACGIEEAGLEIRDTLMWLHSQGYPGSRQLPNGRGTGLKPAFEPILLARRPLEDNLDRTLAKYGTGAMNIDACRIAHTECCPDEGRTHKPGRASKRGRWPANLILSHTSHCASDRCRRGCPVQSLGEPHRFFYCAKANRQERDAGCEQLPRRTVQTFKIGAEQEARAQAEPVANVHPTVKPIELMRWLIRLLTPPDGLVLDPFTGSGSTGAAAVLEQARFLGIERDANYVPIARARITHWAQAAHKATR
jgi:site-specific DNA-methyltransferase (adenine-specific)